MPVHTPKPVSEKLRVDWFGIYFGLILLLLGALVFSHYTPGFQATLTSPYLWVFIGLLAIAGGCIWLGLVSHFRHKTRKCFTANHIFELAWKDPITVPTRRYAINREALSRILPDTDMPRVDRAIQIEPGTDGRGNSITARVYELGGFDNEGFHSFEGGQQGYLLTEGENQVVDLGPIGIWVPFDVELVPHSQIPREVITWLKTNRDNFKENRSPFYRTRGMSMKVEDWVTMSGYVSHAVLHTTGFDGLARDFFQRLENLVRSLPANDSIQKAWKGDAKAAIRMAFKDWLARQPNLQVIMGDGEMKADALRSQNLALLSEVTALTEQLDLKSETIHDYTRRERYEAGRATRAAGAPRSLGPVYDSASRPPSDAETGA